MEKVFCTVAAFIIAGLIIFIGLGSVYFLIKDEIEYRKQEKKWKELI